MLLKYSEVTEFLSGKSRREQYLILLQTEEWDIFRKHLLGTQSNACEKCGTLARMEVEEMSEDKKAEYQTEYDKQLDEFNWRIKHFSHAQWISSILDGTYVGRPVKVVGTYTILQIHHKHYFQNKLPWQYDKKHLEILCKPCHEEVHRTTRIYTYQDENMQFRKEEISCNKCAGTGYIPEYYRRDQGICYDCGGLGLIDNGSYGWVRVK